MLSWIPLLGPILQGISSIVNGFTNLAGVKLTTASQQQIAAMQASTQIITATNDDIALRILRDLAILPVVVWSALIGWDTIIADPRQSVIPHEWMWHVPNYPQSVAYLPYAVIVFLFGNIGLNIWRQKL
jgi:hypothetical protein